MVEVVSRAVEYQRAALQGGKQQHGLGSIVHSRYGWQNVTVTWVIRRHIRCLHTFTSLHL